MISEAAQRRGTLQLGALDASPATPEWVRELRSSARTRFHEHGFPTRRDEDWKYTDLAPITGRSELGPGGRPDGRPFEAAINVRLETLAPSGPRLVFVNGEFAADLSVAIDLPSGTRIGALSQDGIDPWSLTEGQLGTLAPIDRKAFVALNTSQFTDVAILRFARNAALTSPFHLVFVSAGAVASYPRVLLILEEGAEATVLETYLAVGGSPFTNAVTEVSLAAGAALQHCTFAVGGGDSAAIGATHVALGRDARYRSLQVLSGSAINRRDLDVAFHGEGGECSLDGAYIASGSQKVESHTFVDHAVPRCSSHEFYKGVVADQAAAVFSGRVLVRPGAQKTDAAQTNKNLLLSGSATVDTKPHLEILADDVKCSHGAAVGPPDDETLFYLLSRGLGRAAATALLAYGFAAEVLADTPLSIRGMAERLIGDEVSVATGATVSFRDE